MKATRNADIGDLKAISQCHIKAFPTSLSSAMGPAYLCKMFEWYLVDSRAFLFLIEEDGVCCGYCGGLNYDGASQIGSASSMIQHSFNAAIKAFMLRPWLLIHPEFVSKYKLVGKNVYRRIRKLLMGSSIPASTNTGLPPEPHTSLIVIGVHPDFQSKGYGTLLLREFELRALQSGHMKLSLTVKSDNYQALRAYQKNGWKTMNVSRNSTTMQKELKGK